MQDSDPCVICQNAHPQMLMLTCLHDPCINCAVKQYAHDAAGKARQRKYICAICGEATPLDISSVLELERLTGQLRLKKDKTREQRPKQSMAHSASRAYEDYVYEEPPRQPTNKQSQHSLSHSLSRGCQEHEHEQLSYFCVTCMVGICPECAIHGKHHGHTVKQTKRAATDMKIDLTAARGNLQRICASFKQSQDGLAEMLIAISQLNKRHRRAVCELFDLMREEIAKKEIQLLGKLQQMHQANLTLVRQRVQQCSQQKIQADQLLQTVSTVLRKDDLAVLQTYPTLQLKTRLEHLDSYRMPHVQGLRTVNQQQLRDFTGDMADLVSKLDFSSKQLKLSELQMRVSNY